MARRQVSIFINGRQVANDIKSISSEKRKLVRELNRMTIGSDEYNKKAAEIRKLSGIIGKHRQDIKGVESVWQKAGGAIGKFAGVAGVAFTVDAIVDFGKEAFNLGNEMELLGQKAQTVFGDQLPVVQESAEGLAHAMGLTRGQFVDAAAAAGDLLVPMGFTREAAAALSTDVVSLSGALSEWSGGQRSSAEVSDILTKALLGERDSMKQLGVAISEADVTQRLSEKNMKNLTGEALQQAKAIATLELIYEKTEDAQAAFNDGAGSNLRTQAQLTAQFNEVRESIATALIPVFEELLRVTIPVIEFSRQLIDSLVSGEQASGKFGSAINALTPLIKRVGDIVGFLWRSLLAVVNVFTGDFAKAALNAQIAMGNVGNAVLRVINRVSGLIGLKEIKLFDTSKQLAELDQINSKLDETANKRARIGGLSDVPVTGSSGGGGGNSSGRSSRRSSSSGSSSAEDRELQRIAAQQDRINELIAEKRREQEISRLSDEQQKIAKIEDEYNQQIELARVAFGAQSEQEIALEQLKQQRILEIRQEFSDRRIEAFDEEINEELDLFLSQSEEIGEEIVEMTKKSGAEAAQEMAKSFKGIAALVGGVIDVIGEESRAGVALSKALALAQLGISSAEAIGKGIAQSQSVPFPANLAAIAATVGSILSAIGSARAALQSTEVPQRREGGYFDVIGENDRRNYRARYIGSPQGGMLPSQPSLVLASEAGPEYFVPNNLLRQPKVLNYVRAIENIRTGRVPQFQQGGFTNSEAVPSGAQGSNVDLSGLTNQLAVLNNILARPIEARIGIDSLVDGLNEVSDLNSTVGGGLV